VRITGVLGLLLERQEWPHDERVGLSLVPGEEVVETGDLPGRAEGVRVVEDAVEVGVEIGPVVALEQPAPSSRSFEDQRL